MQNNLQLLFDLDESYFRRHVRAVVTLTGNSDLAATRAFFDSGDPVVPPVDYVGFIRDLDTGPFHEEHPCDVDKLKGQYRQLLGDYLETKRAGLPVRRGEFLYQLFEDPVRSIYERMMSVGTPDREWTSGTCQPGRRISVATDGRFHICERIDEGHPIGDVIHGLDLDRCREVCESYYEALPECRKCWVRSLCGICFAQACEGGEFHVTPYKCDATRASIAEKLVTLYSVLEEDPTAFSTGDPLIDRAELLAVPR